MFDVAIIGAGLAGLQLARLLARRGVAVLLVDRRRCVTDKIRTTGIFVRRTFEDFESLHPFLGPPIRQVAIHSPAGRTIEIESARDEFRIGRMAALYEAMLRDAILAGATWWPATSYDSIDERSDHLRVLLRAGAERRMVATRFLAGADGARSMIARDLRLDRNHQWIVGVEDVFAGTTSLSPRLDCWVDPKLAPGYLAWVADDGHEQHVGLAGRLGRFEPAAALDRFESRRVEDGRVATTSRLERRGGLIPVNGVLRRIANSRALLVGDAAGAVSPLTAGGLDACMRMSRVAADVLETAVRERAPISGYDGAAFRARFASRIVSRRIYDMAARSVPLIELAFAAASTPLAMWLVRHVFFGRGSFPDLELRAVEHAKSQPTRS